VDADWPLTQLSARAADVRWTVTADKNKPVQGAPGKETGE